MKLSAALLLLALCASDAARGGTRRRAQDEGDTVAAAPADDEIIADGGQSKAFGTSKKEGGVAIITNFYRDCYYQFEDKDDYVVLEDFESAMNCANNICNVDFLSSKNSVVGLNMKVDQNTADGSQIIGEFRVGCGFSDMDLWHAAFTCPVGYYVNNLTIKQRSTSSSKCGFGSNPKCAQEKVCDAPVYGQSGNPKSLIDRQACTEFVDPNGGITLGKVDGTATSTPSVTDVSVTYTLKCKELYN